MPGSSKNEMLALAFCFWKHSPPVDEKLPSVRIPLDTLENSGYAFTCYKRLVVGKANIKSKNKHVS
jgi:hypothetical protein